jgi:hypothetical protein
MSEKELISFHEKKLFELDNLIKELLEEERRIFEETKKEVQIFFRGETPENTSKLNMDLYEKIEETIKAIEEVVIPEKKLSKTIVLLKDIQQLLTERLDTKKKSFFHKFSDIFVLKIDLLLFRFQKKHGV